VLEEVYPTIERATTNRMRIYLGVLGRGVTPLLLAQFPLRIGVSAGKLRPIDHIDSVGCPVFVINGMDDCRTTREDAILMYSRASSPKQLWLIPHAGHIDLHLARRAEYEKRVGSFLSSAFD
jgi:fermentation-respiration switch protein FrsA (DUF1100 family)